MTTIVDLRTRVLYALGIPGMSTERGFDSDSVDQHIVQAAEELSLYVPAEATADVSVGGGTRTIALSALTRAIAVRSVEYPVGQWPRTLLDFDVWGGTLTLDISPPVTAYTVRVYYAQQHLVDGSGSTPRPEHENVVVEGATALAILARAMGAANTAETATVAPATYQHLRVAQERLNRWRTLLRRLAGGPARRALYTPAAVPSARDTVTWPG
jgi:hypothetical protein